MPNGRARRRGALALIIGTVAGLLLVEGGLRSVVGYHGTAPPGDIQYDRELGWTLAPDRKEWQSAIGYGVWVTTDAEGLRIDGRVETQRTTSPLPTLLVLGDSYAFGYGVSGDAMFASALQHELARSPAPYRVRTAGVPGYSTDQEYLRWRRLASAVRPTHVLLLFHSSDLIDNLHTSVIMGPDRYFKPRFELRDDRLELKGVPVPDKQRLVPPGIGEALKAWVRPLATYSLVQAGAQRMGSAPANVPAQPADAPPEADAITAALLAALDRDTRASGADLTVALVPASPVVTRRVAAICLAQRIPFIDLGPAFADARDVALPFDRHWNARGHAIAAQAVAATIRAR